MASPVEYKYDPITNRIGCAIWRMQAVGAVQRYTEQCRLAWPGACELARAQAYTSKAAHRWRAKPASWVPCERISTPRRSVLCRYDCYYNRFLCSVRQYLYYFYGQNCSIFAPAAIIDKRLGCFFHSQLQTPMLRYWMKRFKSCWRFRRCWCCECFSFFNMECKPWHIHLYPPKRALGTCI